MNDGLSRADVELLLAQPPQARAVALLTGQAGPLAGDAALAYTEAQAGFCYLLHVAWRLARPLDPKERRRRVLGEKPPYEARAMFAARVRAAVSESGDLRDFVVQLGRRLDYELVEFRRGDLAWWRSYLAAHAGAWFQLRQPTGLEECLAAAAVLDEWMGQIRRGMLPDERATEDAGEAT